MIEEMPSPEQFELFGCVLVQDFLDPISLQTISMYMENKIRRNEWQSQDRSPTTKLAYYADPLLETVLQARLSLVSEVCGKELYPSYSYARIYQPGEWLQPHIDRPSCEISVTVNVSYKGNFSPIWMQYKDNQPHSFALNPGDAVVYKGCEAKHWRERLNEDQLNVQFMLHYVDKNGLNADRKYDTRPNLGFSEETRRRS